MTGPLAGLLAAVSVPAATNSFLRGLDEKLAIKECFKNANLGSGSLLTGRLGASSGGDNSIGSRRNSSRALAASFSRTSGGQYLPAKVYARDRVVDFGKNKGSMLGTLSSSYLKWMVKNLKGSMLEDWVEYAQEVLDDPFYRDRIEWEKVEKLLVESHDLAKFSNNRDALAPARMYGWDLDNDAAWSKVNFSLLGTSKGGQIPRVPIVQEPKPKPVTPRKSKLSTRTSAPIAEGQTSSGSLRDELNRRRQQRRERLSAQRDALMGSKAMEEQKVESRFPGREGLLNKLQENRPQDEGESPSNSSSGEPEL